MQDENQVVNQTVEQTATEQDASNQQAESSTVEVVKETQPTIPYDRFKEVNDEKNYYKDLLAQSIATRQQQGETKQQIEEDPYAGMEPEVAAWQRQQDKRVEKLILKEANKLAEPLRKQLQATNMYVTQIIERDFRTNNKDVPPNSAEEKEISDLIGRGLSVQRATWAVMGEKRAAQAGVKKQEVQQTKNQQKAQANLETNSIPSHSGLPKGTKLSFREEMAKALESEQ